MIVSPRREKVPKITRRPQGGVPLYILIGSLFFAFLSEQIRDVQRCRKWRGNTSRLDYSYLRLASLMIK